jgi:NSS family neurotransmitter:Na+ symporter
MEREKFGSRLGFILISAGCAIGFGNVWRFPYIVGQYGGAAFILIYLAFLVIFGLPIMAMEFAVGRASGTSIANAFQKLEKKGSKWHWFSWFGMAGNYLLMMFYTTVTGWMFIYFLKMLRGDFVGQSVDAVQQSFGNVVGNPLAMVAFMVLVVILGSLICSLGLQKGVEKITKVMMVALLGIIAVLAINSILLPGAGEGLRYYLIPDFARMVEQGLGEAIFAAMGQAFFTLSIGMGAMTIFGSYIKKDRRLFGEALSISLLDTLVAFCAGLLIIPACFAYDIPAGQGPGLIFQTLPVVFNHMPGGRIWGVLFFLFMIFAAVSTVVGVFENIVSFGMDLRGWSRRKSCVINLIALIVFALPCALGFNVLSGIQPMGVGSTILDLEDFIISNNILPLGSLVFVLFCTNAKSGWGWGNFLTEANSGQGLKLPTWLRVYCKYVMPIILLFFWAWGIITMF